MQYKLFIFTSAHRWNDIRIYQKELLALSKKYQVEYHAPASFKHKQVNGINIFGLPQRRIKFVRFFTILLILYRLIKSDSDIYHFHDPELIFVD